MILQVQSEAKICFRDGKTRVMKTIEIYIGIYTPILQKFISSFDNIFFLHLI